jgi:hypothetical protein
MFCSTTDKYKKALKMTYFSIVKQNPNNCQTKHCRTSHLLRILRQQIQIHFSHSFLFFIFLILIRIKNTNITVKSFDQPSISLKNDLNTFLVQISTIEI